jgi:hypothetical protein
MYEAMLTFGDLSLEPSYFTGCWYLYQRLEMSTPSRAENMIRALLLMLKAKSREELLLLLVSMMWGLLRFKKL